MHKTLLCVIGSSLLLGCASDPPPFRVSADQIYDSQFRQGGRETISLLREGLRRRGVYGVTDPYVPMRQPEEIVPVWVPGEAAGDDRFVQGHWEHTILKGSRWFTEEP